MRPDARWLGLLTLEILFSEVGDFGDGRRSDQVRPRANHVRWIETLGSARYEVISDIFLIIRLTLK